MHEDERDPIDWSDERHRERLGLDLRGADLRRVDLNHLPLVPIRAGLATREWWTATDQERSEAGAHLEEAILEWAYLEGTSFRWAYLEGAHFFGAYMQESRLRGAPLSVAILQRARLEVASICSAYLGGKIKPRKLLLANLKEAVFDTTTHLDGIILGDKQLGVNSRVDVSWGNVNLAVVDWESIKILGDEYNARYQELQGKAMKDMSRVLKKYQAAVRANRQLAIALQVQGLTEVAARFAYRAQNLQREVSRRQGKFAQYLFSLLLDLLAGYGYKPWRSFFAYLLVITAFATAYSIIGRAVGPALSPVSTWVFSMTSIHGRGFSPGGIKLDNLSLFLPPLKLLLVRL